ncbi:MAG TPA: ABATE domain-containing protein [Candidatus Sulfomarinibacteraceae bacterium]|nr:ABATE domain-containing protein [Candidatus Sulfomarinibacteraceae bacterium]
MTTDHDFSFSGGALCLDFANTCGDRPRRAEDRLSGPDDLVAWGAAAGLIGLDEADRFRREARADPAAAEARFASAVEIREAVYSVCSALAAGRVPPRPELAILNGALRDALPNLELGLRGDGCCWRWGDASSVTDRILWPVVRSTADLVTSDRACLIRECAGESCRWLFLASSRNPSRKWCSMSSCGNRVKARRHYARTAASG